jgi:hypothetical protein
MRTLLLIAMVAGCWHATPDRPGVGSGPTQTPDSPPENTAWRPRTARSPCDVAMEQAFEMARDELQQVPRLKDRLDDVRNAAAESCKETSWSAEVLECFTTAKDGKAVIDCAGRLTPEQNTDMQQRMQNIFSGATP